MAAPNFASFRPMLSRDSSTIIRPIISALEVRGRQYPFYLEFRTIDFGPAGPVQYYYMPASPLRDNDPVREVSNFRSCIEFWYAVTHAATADEAWARDVN